MAQSTAEMTASSSPLAVFLAGGAPATTKSEVRAVLAELAACCPGPLDAAAVPALPPALLARCETIPGGVDLFRILRGERPEARRHRRTHVAASLRGMRACKERTPVAADYPVGHPVPVLAWVYYGGIDAWGRGATRRAQHPKGHWRDRPNQEAALLDVAARFPGQPLTHALLDQAGYHALAKALTAAELAALAAQLALERGLAKRPDGWWTAERTLDTYAELCRTAGQTLSNHALAGMGGTGCSIRVQARRHFCNFAHFQLAAVRRHPDLLPPGQFTANDGTRLESRAELVTYEAIRRALPGVPVSTHVVLPGGRRRSCDLVLAGGRAWVEVLGMSRAEMRAPRSEYQRRYAERWVVKMALYRERGLPLVVVEPADVVDPVRLAGRVGEVATLLGREAPPLPTTDGRVVRAHGTWDFLFLCHAVGEVAGRVGEWPTGAQLAGHGYGSAVVHLRRPGVAARVAAAIGVPLRNRRGEWTPERVIDAHVAWVREHGRYPTEGELAAADQAALGRARRRCFAGRQDELRDEVGRRCGRALPARRLPNGSYATQESCAALLRPLCDRLGRFPREAEMRELSAALYGIVSGRWGMRAMAAYMAVPYAGPRRRGQAPVPAAVRVAPHVGGS